MRNSVRRTALACFLVGSTMAACVEADPVADDLMSSVELEAIMATNGIAMGNGFTLGNGTMLGNGATISNGLTLGNGINLGNGMKINNGLSTSNGINLGNGTSLSGGSTMPDGWKGPYFAPPSGSDLEKWIDVDPANQLRTLRYLIECAAPRNLQVRIYYRSSVYPFYGLVGAGISLITGPDGYAGTSDDSKGLTVADQEKTTACVLARVNARKDVMTLMMLGNFSPLDSYTCEDDKMGDIDEAVFYGNLFLPTPEAYFCLQEDPMDYRETRACRTGASSYNCGVMQYAGSCWYLLGTSDKDPNPACLTKTKKYVSCNGSTYTENIMSDCKNPSRSKTFKYAVSSDFKYKETGEACLDNWECRSGSCYYSKCK